MDGDSFFAEYRDFIDTDEFGAAFREALEERRQAIIKQFEGKPPLAMSAAEAWAYCGKAAEQVMRKALDTAKAAKNDAKPHKTARIHRMEEM